MTPLRTEKVVFLNRSKASRVEVLEYVADLEQRNELSEVLLVIRDQAGNYSFIGATEEVATDPARILGQLEMLKQIIMQHSGVV